MVRYDTRYFQVARQSHLPPARSTVLVRENASGAIEIRYRERLMQWTEITCAGEAHAGRVADPAVHRPASARSAERGPPVAPRHLGHSPRAGPVPGDPAMKSLWKLPQPWTPRTRPPLLGNPQNGFHKLPQAVSLVHKGTFLFR